MILKEDYIIHQAGWGVPKSLDKLGWGVGWTGWSHWESHPYQPTPPKNFKEKAPDGLRGRKILAQVFYFATSLSSTAGFCMWEKLGRSRQEPLTVKMIWFSGMWWSSTVLPEKAISVSPCGTIVWAHREGFSSVTTAWSRVPWKQMGTYRSCAHTSARRQSCPQNEQRKVSSPQDSQGSRLGAGMTVLHQGDLPPHRGSACLCSFISMNSLCSLWFLCALSRGPTLMMGEPPSSISTSEQIY